MAGIICYSHDGSILESYNQWSTGQKLIIRGADTSMAPIFYFSNIMLKSSIIVNSDIDGTDIVVTVPDILLQYAYPIVINVDYIISHSLGFSIRIPVMPRAKPGDYTFDEESGTGGQPQTIPVINNLTTDVATAALAASQGVVLKSMIDNIEVDDQINEALELAKESGEFDGRGVVSILRTGGTGEAGTVDTYTITYSDDTTTTFNIYNGANGNDGSGEAGESGDNGATFTPYVDSDGNLSWSNDKGLANPPTVNIMGETGSAGESGENGATFTPHVDSSGNLSWTNDKGLENPEIVTIKGDNGVDGVNGADGSDALINGVNTLTINTSGGLTSVQSGNILTISTNYQYGTEYLSAGSSPLETGMLYFVYE